MRRGENRERILNSSVELFNQNGVVATTTNHIADHLGISPGNLYFHFANREAIVRELFERMCRDTYAVWKENPDFSRLRPIPFVERSFEVYWKYRFFHREMYHLRRKDPLLAKRWKAHINKVVRLLQATYRHWVEDSILRPIQDLNELHLITDIVLITSSNFFQFYESKERPPTKRSQRLGIAHILRFLQPYMQGPQQQAITDYLKVT